MAAEPPDPKNVPLTWVGYDELPILFANQILIQHQPGEFILSFGQATAPPIVGTPEEQVAQAEQIEFVPVRPLIRLGLTPARLREFVATLQVALDRQEQAERDMGDLR